jgi:hypothetical protein
LIAAIGFVQGMTAGVTAKPAVLFLGQGPDAPGRSLSASKAGPCQMANSDGGQVSPLGVGRDAEVAHQRRRSRLTFGRLRAMQQRGLSVSCSGTISGISMTESVVFGGTEAMIGPAIMFLVQYCEPWLRPPCCKL